MAAGAGHGIGARRRKGFEMKISTIEVKDFKRVRDITVKPGDDGALVIEDGALAT